MALLFSSVSVTDGMYETEFLVGGIPRELEDLEGWTAFDDFTEDISEETDIQVRASAYIYGEGETENATPEEIAYFMKRMEMDDSFLADHCDNIEDVDFSIQWSPDELYGMEMD